VGEVGREEGGGRGASSVAGDMVGGSSGDLEVGRALGSLHARHGGYDIVVAAFGRCIADGHADGCNIHLHPQHLSRVLCTAIRRFRRPATWDCNIMWATMRLTGHNKVVISKGKAAQIYSQTPPLITPWECALVICTKIATLERERILLQVPTVHRRHNPATLG